MQAYIVLTLLRKNQEKSNDVNIPFENIIG
jgi:hypothetical protein